MKTPHYALMFTLILSTLSGCSSVQRSWRTLVSTQSPDIDDPLAPDTLTSSDTYLTAKKELGRSTDSTMLAFAAWKVEQGKYLEARNTYQNILAGDPQNVQARVGMAQIEFETGRKQQAEDILKATVQMHPKSAEAQLELGRLYVKQKQWGRAIPTIQQAVALAGSDQNLNRNANYELGLALAQNNQHDEALGPLTIATGRSSAMYNIGFLLSEQGRTEEAANWVRQSLSNNPDQRTRSTAEKMLASLAAPSRNTNVAAQGPSRVDIAQTKTSNFRETWNGNGGRSLPTAGAPVTPASSTHSLQIQPGQPQRPSTQLVSGQRSAFSMHSANRPATVLPTQTPASLQKQQFAQPPSAWQPNRATQQPANTSAAQATSNIPSAVFSSPPASSGTPLSAGELPQWRPAGN